MKATDFIARFEQFCPPELVMPDDPVGLQIGSLDKDVQKILVSLDVRPEVVAEAIEKKIDLIIVKHPPIFRKIGSITDTSPQTQMYIDLIKHDVAVYCAHTNMDIIHNGLNDWFCEALGLDVVDYMEQTHTFYALKMQIYLPAESVTAFREALKKSGIGTIGDYTGCSFAGQGSGYFTPTDLAHPFVGSLGKEEATPEVKLEFNFWPEQTADVLKIIRDVHPYEEPVYDYFTDLSCPKTFGIGRMANLKEVMTLTDFTALVKKTFDLDGVRLISHEPNKLVKKIAICGGSAAKFYPSALKKNADCYITGDVDYHTGHDMIADGLSVIDAGHTIEKLCIPKLSALFETWKAENNWEVDIVPSEVNTNPFTYK